MPESLVFTVEIGYKMLGSLWQIKDSLEIYDFGTCSADRRKCLREQFKYAAVILYIRYIRFCLKRPFKRMF